VLRNLLCVEEHSGANEGVGRANTDAEQGQAREFGV
jgi:hypothetical protein